MPQQPRGRDDKARQKNGETVRGTLNAQLTTNHNDWTALFDLVENDYVPMVIGGDAPGGGTSGDTRQGKVPSTRRQRQREITTITNQGTKSKMLMMK